LSQERANRRPEGGRSAEHESQPRFKVPFQVVGHPGDHDAHDQTRGDGPPSDRASQQERNDAKGHKDQQKHPRSISRTDLRSGVVALKLNRRKASEHPAAGKTQMTPLPSLPKSPKKPKRPKR
jgi:hypothetical protein